MLKNKVILVTGSSAGIGKAIARECRAQGAKVMIHGRDPKRTEETAKELADHTGHCIADIADLNACQKLIDATVEHFGRIDVLVNNAGIFPRTTIDDTTPENFETIFSVNVRAPVFLTQAAVKHFRKQPEQFKSRGVIVNIGSMNAHCGQPCQPTTTVFSARRRHLNALNSAQTQLEQAQGVLHAQQLELLAEHLRLAHTALAEITGQITTDDLLGEIFSDFCVGK